MTSFIPVNEPLLDGNEKKYLNECIDTGWISSEGPFVKQFEEQFAQRTERKHAIAVTNGTAAIDVAVTALGIGKGDEVIMPTFTIISCINQIVRSGATPVLVDSDPVTWNMDVSQIEGKITTRTKAILIVHIYGLPVDINPVIRIAEKYNLKIIEDAAQMHGQTYYGKPCGSFGDISTFSFYPNKHVTTGEGGMIVTDNDRTADTCRGLRNLCFQQKRRFVHERLGWNLRMTNIQAAIGLAQLERLDEFVAKKRAMGSRYTELLSNIDGLQLPWSETGYAKNIYWVFGIVIDKKLQINAEDIAHQLSTKGVGTRPFFWPMHEQPVLKKHGLFDNREKFPVAEWLARKGFYIPSGLTLTNQMVDHVAKTLRSVIKELI